MGRRGPNGFLTVVFAAHDWTGEPENREPRKRSQIRRVDASAIPEAFVDTTAIALHHYLTRGADVSLDGWQTA